MEKILHIALTGHRPKKLGGYNINTQAYKDLQQDLEDYILYQLDNNDIIIGHSGLALGADTIWSKAILAMREMYPGRVKFHAEIPMMTQSTVWFKESDISFWQTQVNSADFKTVYGDLSDYPESERKNEAVKLLDIRNKGMINNCDILLAIWDGSPSGTGNAVEDARKSNIPVVEVDPAKYFKADII